MSDSLIETRQAVGAGANLPKSKAMWRVGHLPAKALQRLQRYYRRLFRKRYHVFVHHGPFELPANLAFQIARYNRFSDVPEDVCRTIVQREGQRALEMDRQEMDEGSVMWVAWINNQVAGFVVSTQGRAFRSWFTKLQDQDIVLGRGRTYPEYRGRGLCPTMMRYIMHVELADGGIAYTDCAVDNHSSIRGITKAGFSRLGTMKQLVRLHARGSTWNSMSAVGASVARTADM
jgi:RimJ/RimL family protein N-acetyltransferase